MGGCLSSLVVGVLLAVGAELDRPFSYANVELVIVRFARRRRTLF